MSDKVARLYKGALMVMGAGMVAVNMWNRGELSIDGLGIAGIMIIVTAELIDDDVKQHCEYYKRLRIAKRKARGGDNA